MLLRHREDIRIENLLLQKEVSQILITGSNSTVVGANLEANGLLMIQQSQDDDGGSSPESLLEQIVYQVLSEQNSPPDFMATY